MIRVAEMARYDAYQPICRQTYRGLSTRLRTACAEVISSTACCSRDGPRATRLYERLFRRPSGEDSRCRRTWALQDPGGPRLRCEPLLGEALREESRPRRVSSPEEEPWICSEAGRESHEALGGRPEAERPFATLQERRDYIRALTGLSVGGAP